MLSAYFKKKVATKKFDDDLKWSLGEIQNKKILLYGAGECFKYLLEKYQLRNLNIIAIADKKFEKETTFEGFRAISPDKIINQDYDVILITNEYSRPILNYLVSDLNIKSKEIRTVFNEEIADERNNYLYLEKFNFEKHLNNLNKKLKDKKVVIYGAGALFDTINIFYDLSKLNIIAISDRRFSVNDNAEIEYSGYRTVSPDKIKDLNPDYVLVATKFFINIIEDLDENALAGTKIKIKPMIKKPFLTLWKEIWG